MGEEGATRTALLQEQIGRHRAAALRACGEDLARILEQYNCELLAIPQFTPEGRVVAVVQLRLRDGM